MLLEGKFMNISITNLYTPKIFTPAFAANKQSSKNNKLEPIDTFELNKNNETLLPQKLEFTETEATYKEELSKLRTLESNIAVQKQNLRDFYSAQDRSDYRELLKERQKGIAKLKRIAKSAGIDEKELEFNVYIKKEYNRIAPKLFRAKSKQEISQLQDFINSKSLFAQTRRLLNQLIKQCLERI